MSPGTAPARASVLRRAVELGVNFFDTAESYGPHTDETLIAEALHPYPKGFVIATKCGLARPSPGRWDADGRPEKLKRDLEGSLKRLKLERIDLYQLHTIDPKVPLEESLGVLVDAQRAGKVRHIGVSNFNGEAARARAQGRHHRLGAEPLQPRRPQLGAGSAECEKLGIAFLPWYPLGDGAAL